MSREPIRFRSSLITKRCLKVMLWGISRRFHRLFPRNGQVAHALRTLAPVAINTSTNLRVMLPLDLHVLSLPLAFILSQDQTLHCIIYKSLACPDTYNSIKKLTLLDKFYCILGTCFLYFPSIFSMNFSCRYFSNGLQRYDFFLYLQIFLQNFSIFFLILPHKG